MAPPRVLTILVALAPLAFVTAARDIPEGDPVGCYRFDRPLGHSASGDVERGDASWYTVRLLPKGAVARPDLASANWRELYARRSNWTLSNDTLRVRVFTGLVGWDLTLVPRNQDYVGVALYLSDAIGGSPFTTAVYLSREVCPSARLPNGR